MSDIKKITISKAGGYTMYYYDHKGDRYFNFKDKHSCMRFADLTLGSIVCDFIECAAKEELRTKKKKYKNWRELLATQREIFSTISKKVYKDLESKLQLS